MDLFNPPEILFNESFQGSPYVIQVTYFSCGGIASSVWMLLKVTDGSSLLVFINDWAAVACGEKVSPMFLAQQVISSSNNGQITIPENEIKLEKDNVVTRTFSFDPPKLADLKAINTIRDNSGTIQINPSRVEVVISLIYKCVMAASTVKTRMSRPSMLIQTANLRPPVIPPLPENSVGIFVGPTQS
ncbi:hypothetical protein ACH5RR_040448 [Cinchona calisaya]|uniref:Uncharacterized protein n=1 Tax=Cinchona calisaya TaxID=153742 RepID=A0ABD2XT03_9GENT